MVQKHSIDFFLLALTYLTFEDETNDEHVNSMDFDPESCVDGESLMENMDHYRIDLVIPQKFGNGKVTVYFNQTVHCRERQVQLSFFDFKLENSLN